MLAMRYSKAGLDLTKHFEADGGPPLKAYWDKLGKVWTIAYGHTRLVKEGDTCTLAQAEAWLIEDMDNAVHDVCLHVTIEDTTQGEFDALCDFAFNLGCDALNKSTLLRLYNHHDKAAAAEEFEKWDHAGGKVVAGLLRRRLAEKAEFLGTEEKEG
jgi:lysozyme